VGQTRYRTPVDTAAVNARLRLQLRSNQPARGSDQCRDTPRIASQADPVFISSCAGGQTSKLAAAKANVKHKFVVYKVEACRDDRRAGIRRRSSKSRSVAQPWARSLELRRFVDWAISLLVLAKIPDRLQKIPCSVA
jgi:hypothetical protein